VAKCQHRGERLSDIIHNTAQYAQPSVFCQMKYSKRLSLLLIPVAPSTRVSLQHMCHSYHRLANALAQTHENHAFISLFCFRDDGFQRCEQNF